ncbi:ATP-binding cassette-type vacuolar membrane transporter Hmt1 [Tieghemiomyces parasiticus]|uniref:ATP-binding cassette-type vacuolar membrane transporter Hmt1 n=1 Tax=Tieghemiomyces parasiticus TaxID=78921 RepID=A0A9W8E0Z0_9FUNG|nr:ATP-binding cassette-type vacuolar membrane transporter Hmt1 [Tieghemiomyces parasiticus]
MDTGSYLKLADSTHQLRRFLSFTILYFDLIFLLFLCAIFQDKYTPADAYPTLSLIIAGHLARLIVWTWHLALTRPPLIAVLRVPFREVGAHVLLWCASAVLTSIALLAPRGDLSVRGTTTAAQTTTNYVIPNPWLVTSIYATQTALLTALLATDAVSYHLRHQSRKAATLAAAAALPLMVDLDDDDLDSDSVASAGHSASFLSQCEIRNPTVKFKPEVPPMSLADFFSRLRKFVPYLFTCQLPRSTYICVCLCFTMLFLGRYINLLAPIQYKVVVDHLTDRSLVFHDILVFVALRLLQGDIGILQTLHDFCWTPVSQATTRTVAVAIFRHLHSLPLEFHTNRKTGEILRIQDRGVSSIESLLSCILFKILPTMADIVIACLFFCLTFDLYFGGIVILTMTAYMGSTIVLTEWHKHYRRLSNNLDNEMEAKAVDSLLNHETVKHNSAEEFEVRVYTEAMQKYQGAEWMNVVSLNVLRCVQNCSMQLGMLLGCLLCTRRIMDGDMTVGDFVLYLSYLNQMYQPLNWLGNSYRLIQKNFVDMERMLDVLSEPAECGGPTAADFANHPTSALFDHTDRDRSAQASPPVVVDCTTETPVRGEIEFRDVAFSYDEYQPVLRDMSFKVPAGATVALVGPSGSGKSTLLKLLYRFYELDSGAILLDGRDIRTMPPHHLRSVLGMVPQDTALFNDSIRYNIQYGRAGQDFDAVTSSQIEAAARLAQIHFKIASLPEGYNTRVGERGARLSGGERQRVAIARTILKDPRVVLLDEATSALDTYTELKIQSALHNMTHNRTTLVVAHRLSTVVHADLILVIKDGCLVERGTHAELLANPEGVYFQLWMTQLREENNLLGHYDDADALIPPPPPAVVGPLDSTGCGATAAAPSALSTVTSSSTAAASTTISPLVPSDNSGHDDLAIYSATSTDLDSGDELVETGRRPHWHPYTRGRLV